jgi:hypothetical protein
MWRNDLVRVLCGTLCCYRWTVDICRGCYEVQSQSNSQVRDSTRGVNGVICGSLAVTEEGKAVSEGRRRRCWEMPV